MRLEHAGPGVRILTLDRAVRLNALTDALVRALGAALDEVAADRDCHCLVLTGAGRAFSAGLDLEDYGDSERVATLGTPLAELERQRELAALSLRLHRMPQTVVAAVNGPAAGGGFALVCASDLRIAARSARFGVSFIRAGFSACDLGVSWLLPRLVGAARAHELMLTGRLFDADEAREIGLVLDVVDDDALLDAALAKAAQVALNPPASVQLTKQGMWLALEVPSLEAAIELENRQQVLAGLTADRHEATAAFLEKRPPHYQHR
ncbi:enoyl-CoA hydratase/isomerase family protein [Nocardioides anomalus]|uniref:Enoyl-CoA hydratase/isomerase family protein n=1 Tax=Nocardioides anomalus TaxID=2712223 RepID=A0A6G6WLF0_9ACTN|nr:enoyl-CoA hydratase/isomerase family protein [Nocardioides anomalus]